MRFFERFKCWRHGRGFGVHSPYAFRMVSDVLHLPVSYSYYQYRDIARERARLRAPVSLDEAFLIFRLVVEFQPAQVFIAARGPLHRLLCSIVHLAVPAAAIIRTLPDGDGRLMVIAFDQLPFAVPRDAAVYLSRAALPQLPPALPHGHIYRNPRRAVIAPGSHIPFQTFDIKF